MIKRSETKTLGKLIQEYLDNIDPFHKRREAMLLNAWPEVVGKAIANRTSRIEIKKRTLYVYMNSSVARSEIMAIRHSIVKALNEKAGQEVIEDIIVR